MGKVRSFGSLSLSLVLSIAVIAGCAPAARADGLAPAPAAWLAVRPDLDAAGAKALVAGVSAAGDRDFLEKAYGLILRRDPETALAYGLSRPYGVPEDEPGDLSDAHALGTRELYLALLAEVERRRAAYAPGEPVVLAAMSRWLSDKAADIAFSYDHYPVSPSANSADQLALDYFTEYRPIRDEAEAARWIASLEALPAKMKDLAAALDLRASLGIVLPRGIHEYTLYGIRNIAEAAPEDNPFYEAFSRKLDAAIEAGGVERGRRGALLSRAAAAIARHALPAWRTLADALERQAGRVPREGGASSLPNGAAFYAACLSRQTTAALDAKAIHELGKKELARVQEEIRARFSALGYPGRDAGIAELYRQLARKEGYLSGQALLGRIAADIARMDSRLGEVVSTRPSLKVEAVAGEMGGYYQPPSSDGSRPGRYFVASGDRRYVWDIATTVWHETIPGHHLQIARAMEADLPGFLRAADFPAFTEGWALYAERLAFEMGFYEGDPAGDLGRLRMEALRAARLVADTGVNAMGWSYEKARAFLSENTGLEDGMVQSDVTRYFIDPGQATAYYVGFSELLRLRSAWREAKGQGSDLRAFHELVLRNGALPLDLLASVVEGAIAPD